MRYNIAAIIVFLTFVVKAQNYTPTPEDYQILQEYQASLKYLNSIGIDPFVPDYSQEGGGASYKVFTSTKAYLQSRGLLHSSDIVTDGWHDALVDYSNSNTLTESRYILSVKVENNRVTAISFGEGKSVHTGANDHDYLYSGGHLKQGKTTVIIETKSSIISYRINIK